MIHNICDLIDNLPETEQSRDVLLALMGSRDSFARGWTIERLSKFREDLINESVIGEVKSMANNDQSQRNKSLAYDFMSRNPDVRLHDCLNKAPADICRKCEASYVTALYRNLGESSLPTLREFALLTHRAELAATSFLCISYITDKICMELLDYLVSRRFYVRLMVTSNISDAIGSSDDNETVVKIWRALSRRLKYEKNRFILDSVEKSIANVEMIIQERNIKNPS